MKNITTTDLYFATFLSSKGVHLIDIEWTSEGKGIFVFDPAPDLTRDYWEGQPTVRVKEYVAELLKMKDQLFISKRNHRDKTEEA